MPAEENIHHQLLLTEGRLYLQLLWITGHLHNQLTQTADARRLQPHHTQQGDRGREGAEGGGEEEKVTTQHGNTVHLYSAACHSQQPRDRTTVVYFITLTG